MTILESPVSAANSNFVRLSRLNTGDISAHPHSAAHRAEHAVVYSHSIFLVISQKASHPAGHQFVPFTIFGGSMRDPGKKPKARDRYSLTPAPPPPGNGPGVSEGIVPEAETLGLREDRPLTKRELLQKRMPSRERIQAVIDRVKGKRRPWLDDKYDWEPKG
jgi:hypothetical protein